MKKSTLIMALGIFSFLGIYAQNTGIYKDERDGHIYKTIKIGNQIWLAENLAFKAEKGCWAYQNEERNVKKYGYLYNLETAKKVCPTGWYLPIDSDWQELIRTLGGENKAAAKMMVDDPIYWVNSNSTNESGFSALPGGVYLNPLTFRGQGEGATFWSTQSTYNIGKMYRSSLGWYESRLDVIWRETILRTQFNYGKSVRCIK